VVLTDIEMPDMNGFEFAETIRGRCQHLSSMPIIALSSMVSPAAIERGGRPASTITSPSSIAPA
jgi:two-component system chemotaxis sensor kinase CheA